MYGFKNLKKAGLSIRDCVELWFIKIILVWSITLVKFLEKLQKSFLPICTKPINDELIFKKLNKIGKNRP